MKSTKSLSARPYFQLDYSKRQKREKNTDHSSNRIRASKQTMIMRQHLQRAGRRGLPLRKHLVRAFHNWWLEILASLLLLFAFSGLVTVLRKFQNRPLPEWPLGFSINTTLAVFGAIFRGPALFIAAEGIGQLKWHWLAKRRSLSDFTTYDEASRGPWGSTKLLWLARWRDVTALVAALITVTTLGLDPFTQAVVSYYGCNVAVGDNAAVSSISRINSLLIQGGAGYDLSTGWRIALDDSFYDPTNVLPNFTCATDSCSFFQPYHSIGICSTCVNVTNQLHIECAPGAGHGCNYTLTKRYYDRLVNTTAGFLRAPVADGDPENSASISWQVLSVWNFVVTIDSEGYMVPGGGYGDIPSHITSTIDLVSASPVLASRCSLYYCVRTYTATIEHGQLRETLQATSNDWNQCSDKAPVLGTVKVDCLDPAVQARLVSDGSITASAPWMAWNGSYLNGTLADGHISESSRPAIPVECAYQAQLAGKDGGWSPEEGFSDPLVGVTSGSGWNTTFVPDSDSSSLLLWLYRSGTISVDSIQDAFNNFTTGVSNYLRTLNKPIPRNISEYIADFNYRDWLSAGANPVSGKPEDWNHPATGQAFLSTTCIHVRWPWLALPAAIFVATLALLVALIVQTADSDGFEVWKSSQNALIWHGLDGPAVDESLNLVTKEDMDQRAKEIEVRLGKTRLGWSIIQDE